jgi:hypothetical protein
VIKQTECGSCRRAFDYQQFHAGFGDQGFMYGAAEGTVLTWSAFDPAYRGLVDALPWMLTEDQKRRVESEIKPGFSDEPFGFDNVPRCPHCHQPVDNLLDQSRAYFVITADRIDGEQTNIWRERDRPVD